MKPFDEMTEGYFDGFQDTRDEFPSSLANRGKSYIHGWLNGRDDRLHKPRDLAKNLREQADAAIEADERSAGR